MVDWTRWHTAKGSGEPRVSSEERGGRRLTAGKYSGLQTYLEGRFADTIVLRFLDIEDLIGSPLPEAARLLREWWTDPEPGLAPAGHADAWRLARRTATPNLLAQTVIFERV